MGNQKDSVRFCPKCFRTFAADTERCPDDDQRLADFPTEESLVGGTLDDKYDIVGRIGRGGMGTVYHAHQKLIGREVALKVLRPEFSKDVHAIQRFFTEVRAACRLRSRHCVIVHDFGLSKEGHLYFTMELLQGRPLTRLLKDGPLDTEIAVHIAMDICSAVEDAHGHGIVHRDLKPDNVMLVRDAQGSFAKVLDFGIAKLLTEQDGLALTQTGMVCGTPEYMSPEQARGDHIGFASDLYSLGILLYEMLAGLPPFRAPSPMRVLMKHINDAPTPLKAIAPDVAVPVGLEQYLLRMLAKDPADRPESAAAVRSALEGILDSSPQTGTTNLPPLVSSSDGVRRVTIPFANPDPLAGLEENTGASGKDHQDRPDHVHAADIPGRDTAPGPETRSLVGSIGGARRRYWLLGLAFLGALGATSSWFAWNHLRTPDDSAPQAASGIGKAAPDDAVQAPLADVPSQDVAGAPDEFVSPVAPDVAGDIPVAPEVGLAPEDRGQSVVDVLRIPEATGTEAPVDAEVAGEASQSPSTVLIPAREPEQAAIARARGVDHQAKGRYDKAVQAFQEAKELGGDATTLDPLIEECRHIQNTKGQIEK